MIYTFEQSSHSCKIISFVKVFVLSPPEGNSRVYGGEGPAIHKLRLSQPPVRLTSTQAHSHDSHEFYDSHDSFG